MKKILSLLIISVLLLTCLAPMAMAAESTVVTVETKQVYASMAGKEVTLAVTTSAPAASFEAVVSVDSRLTNVAITVGSFRVFETGANGLVGGATTASQQPAGSVMFYVTATIPADAKANEFYDVSVAVDYVSINNVDDYATSVVDGGIEILCQHVEGTPVEEDVVPATCGKDGSYNEVVYCSVCGEKLSSTPKTIAATGNHTAGDPIRENEKPATCGAAGSYDEVVYCSVCGEKLSSTPNTIPATGNHTAGEAVRENEKPATCKEAGSYDEVVYCSVCGEEISRTQKTIDKLTTHTPGEPVRENEKPATCKEAGSYDEVVYCSVCGEEISRTQKTIDKLTTHTPGEPVRENVVEATCKETGSYEEVIYCSVCGEEISRTEKVIEKAEHTPGKAVEENRKEPSCSKTGSVDLVVYCTVCGHEISRDTQTIEKLPHVDKNKDDKCDICGAAMDDDEPKNGDITPYPVYFLMAAMAVVAVAYGLKRKFDI